MSTQAHLLYRYLNETLGIQYMPRVLAVEPQTHNQVIWQSPQFKPEVIFFNQDLETNLSEAATEDLFKKITQAMHLNLDKVWYVDSQNRSFMDFLNWLKNKNLVAPIVVMKNEPDIQNFIQNAGSFNWVECFSLKAMLDKTALKKPTWEVLKLLLEKK